MDHAETGLLRADRSLHHEVYAVIVEWIQQGRFRPGDRISEAAIAQRLGVSRGPVREAMTRLDHEGVIVRRPRRAPIVAELTPQTVAEVVAVRQLIEGHAARCACQTLTPDDIARLEGLIEAMDASAQAGRWTETASLNAEFHQTVVNLAASKLLSKLWQTLHPLTWLLAAAVPAHTPHDRESLVARHRTLLTALQAGDPERAEAAFRDHVQRVGEHTRRALITAAAADDQDAAQATRRTGPRDLEEPANGKERTS